MIYRAIITLLFGLSISGCSTQNKGDAILKEAAIVHNEAVMIATELKVYLEKDSVHIQDSIRAWQREVDAWEGELIEVPGNEKHDHTNHDHKHSAIPDITSEQMLAAQLEMKNRIKDLQIRITKTKHE